MPSNYFNLPLNLILGVPLRLGFKTSRKRKRKRP
jgi:hypothetical protein